MMLNNTLAQLRELKLEGMAAAVQEQLSSSATLALSFEERLALLVDREVHRRGDKRRAALLKRARLKYPQAAVEDVDARAGRGLERPALMSLALSRWVQEGQAILITGPTGSGKSWLACALAAYACRRAHSALYLRVPRLAEELRLLHGNGGLRALARRAGTYRRARARRLGARSPGQCRACRSARADRRPRRHARNDRHQPVAHRALARVDRRRDDCRRDP